jgi:hypothetical protein
MYYGVLKLCRKFWGREIRQSLSNVGSRDPLREKRVNGLGASPVPDKSQRLPKRSPCQQKSQQ